MSLGASSLGRATIGGGGKKAVVITSDLGFSVAAPSFSVGASASLPQPNSIVGFNIGSPVFSASASVTLPQPESYIGFGITGPIFSVSAAATAPSATANINLSITGPIFSVIAFASGNAIIREEGKTIDLINRSRAVYIIEG